MIGIIVILFISWGILKFQGENLSVLGFKPTKKRLVQSLTGFLIASGFALAYFYYTVFILDANLIINDQFGLGEFFQGVYWTLKSVLWEELLFRGVLFYCAIKFFGTRKAIILSAVIFGIYHWFSYNIIGDVTSMIYVFLLTAIAGTIFAYAFVVTRSIYLQIALHFGWNFISVNIFSQGPLEDQLFVVEAANTPTAFYSISFFLIQFIIFPTIIFMYLRYLDGKNKKSAINAQTI